MDRTSESRFSRVIEWLTRGEVPLDGFNLADENLAPPIERQRDGDERKQEGEEAGLLPRAPVSWGNFR